MKYASLCSGIEAATVAWHSLGWQPQFFSEIEPFPCALLNHHYPNTPNLGDMTKFHEWQPYSIDILVGGTPCQSFSVAGLRGGLNDPRGNLMLTYGAIAAKYRPRWVVWENVPGVLSSEEGRDFASFLGLLTGQCVEVPKEGWQNSGVVAGISSAYGVAWRVLDAQYVGVDSHPFAVPQRRRRVFVVGHIGADWRRAAAVLFEQGSLRGDPAPCRKSRKDVAPTLSARTKGGGGLGMDFELDGGIIPVAPTLDASFGRLQGCSGQDMLHRHGHLVCVSTGQAGAEIAEDYCPTLTCNHEAPYIAHSLRAQSQSSHSADLDTYIPVVAHTLKGEGFDGSEDGTGRGTPIIAQEVTPTLTSNGDAHSGFRDADGLVITFDGRMRGAEPKVGRPERLMQTMVERTGAIDATKPWNVATGTAVRRLTVRECECERLQGFPDDYTLIPYKGKAPDKCPYGPRYKALGNSMATNCMRWLGQRIEMVDQIQ